MKKKSKYTKGPQSDSIEETCRNIVDYFKKKKEAEEESKKPFYLRKGVKA